MTCQLTFSEDDITRKRDKRQWKKVFYTRNKLIIMRIIKHQCLCQVYFRLQSISVLRHLDSQTIWSSTTLFMEKTSWRSNKTSGLYSWSRFCTWQPFQADTCMTSHTSLRQQRRFGFWTNSFLNSFPEWLKFKDWGSSVHLFFGDLKK